MKVWRICKQRHQASVFSGVGAEQTGGRWNHKGITIVYCSENLSLAALELFVHVSPGSLPGDLISVCAELPDSVLQVTIAALNLPETWRTYPGPDELRWIGGDWIKQRTSLILRVPSAINPLESNLLLNPAHPEMSKLILLDVEPFRFDPRMFDK